LEKEKIYSKLKSLVQKFETNKYHYLSKNYLEEEVKIDFINPLFETLGWDIRNTKALSPYEREVVVEKGETIGHPDYNFRIDGQTKFFIEAKAPHEPLHKVNHVLQAKSYAWNTKNVFIVLLTDFEEFRLFDATIKPDAKNPDQGLIFELSYNQYLDNIDKLMLLSKEEVEKGSLDKLILKDLKSKKLRIPVDKAFLEDLSQWREELAKDIYKRNIKELEDRTDEKRVKIQVKILNEAVQKILNRLIFIRIAEDRKIIEPKSLLDEVEWWKAGGKRRDLHRRLTDRFMGWNQDFNGEILKIGPCDVLAIDSHLLAKTIEGLYFPTCPYRFDVIGVELLGSIYERYLGKTIRVTPKRVKIEEKPEVRKAGGVYYTPQYIVDYIVKNTVEKVIKKKTPKQIEKIKILDPACGSGSFLLAAFHTLIDYHFHYYEKHPEESGQGALFPDVIVDYDGTRRLSIEKKAQILKNNIFGVDIDPQAVEIAMMSLYLKCLEGERDLPRKKELLPSLAKNIRCGNSLISYDIFNQLTLFEEEEKERINPFDWYSKSTGFGEIMEKGGFDVVIGNPPYVRQEFLKTEKSYYNNKYKTFTSTSDIYILFIERAINLLKENGLFSFIVSNKYTRAEYGRKLRKFLLLNTNINQFNDFEDLPVFGGVTTYPSIIVCEKVRIPSNKNIQVCIFSELPREKISDYIKQHSFFLHQKRLSEEPWIFTRKEKLDLKEKIRKAGKSLVEYCGEPKSGIKTGLNKVLIVSKDKMNEIIGKNDFEREIFRPILRAKDIERWCYNFKELYIIFLENKNLNYYPNTKKYLETYKSELAKRTDIAGKINRRWYDLRECAYYNKYSNPKIIYPDISIHCKFAFDENKMLLNNTAFMIDKNDKYFLGILNSKLIEFYFSLVSAKFRGGYFRFIPVYVNQIPIRTIDFNNPKEKAMHNKMVEFVEKMLELNNKKSTLPPSSKREKIEREIKIIDEKIDELVYELYGITDEERKIIEEKNNDY
jgi:type I restriction-modification system DNA methylase subunit